MIRISLSAEEKGALTRLRLDRSSNISERAYYVLLSDTGKSISDISQHLARNKHTVRLWLKRYKEKGIEGWKTKNNPDDQPRKRP